jgi:hypothetical protein
MNYKIMFRADSNAAAASSYVKIAMRADRNYGSGLPRTSLARPISIRTPIPVSALTCVSSRGRDSLSRSTAHNARDVVPL